MVRRLILTLGSGSGRAGRPALQMVAVVGLIEEEGVARAAQRPTRSGRSSLSARLPVHDFSSFQPSISRTCVITCMETERLIKDEARTIVILKKLHGGGRERNLHTGSQS